MSIRLLVCLFWMTGGSLLAKSPELYTAQCAVFEAGGQLLWKFPGNLCAFLPDGRFAAQSVSGFAFFDPRGKALWRKNLHAHHELRLAGDGRSLLLIASRLGGKRQRSDRILRVGLDGQLRGELVLEKSRGFLRPAAREFRWCPGCVPGAETEVSHVNSLQEIPENGSGAPALKKGNLLFFEALGGVAYVADRRLKRILWSLSLRALGFGLVHDLQLLPDGKLLFFANEGARASGEKKSRIVMLDPATKRELWSLSSAGIHSELQGSVQPVGEGKYLVSFRSGKGSRAALCAQDSVCTPLLSLEGMFSNPVQNVRRFTVDGFLGKNSAL